MTISGAGADRTMTQIYSKNAPQSGQALSRAKQEAGSKAFDEKLRALEDQDNPFDSRGFDGAVEGSLEGGLTQEDSMTVLAAAALDMPRAAAAIAPMAEPQPSNAAMPNEIAQAHLDRMAAAIAEIAAKPGQDAVTVDFGNNIALFKSAVVARDASGMIAITMVTPNAAIPPNAWMAMRNQLAERLDRRKLGVRSIMLDDEQGDKPTPVTRG
jgi:hypothetical protein